MHDVFGDSGADNYFLVISGNISIVSSFKQGVIYIMISACQSWAMVNKLNSGWIAIISDAQVRHKHPTRECQHSGSGWNAESTICFSKTSLPNFSIWPRSHSLLFLMIGDDGVWVTAFQ